MSAYLRGSAIVSRYRIGTGRRCATSGARGGVSDERVAHPAADAVVTRQACIDELVRAVLIARDSAQLGRDR